MATLILFIRSPVVYGTCHNIITILTAYGQALVLANSSASQASLHYRRTRNTIHSLTNRNKKANEQCGKRLCHTVTLPDRDNEVRNYC